MSDLHDAINANIDTRDALAASASMDQSDASLRDFIRSLTPRQVGALGMEFENLRRELKGSDGALDILMNFGCIKYAELFHDLIREAKEATDAA